MTEINSKDPNLEGWTFSPDVEDQYEAEAEAFEAQKAEEEAAKLAEESGTPAQGQATPQPKTEKKEEGSFLDGMMEMMPPSVTSDEWSVNNMGGRARTVAGTIDTVMDLTSKFLPFMQKPADWWDEVSGRKTETDPLKKAERDMASILVPTLLTGGLIGSLAGKAGLAGKSRLLVEGGADLAADFLISGVSDSTSEAGNLGSLIEDVTPYGVYIPWASRDSDSPDTIYWKNMSENMFLGSALPLARALTFKNAGNVVIPKNDVAKAAVEAKPAKPTQLGEALQQAAAKKQAAQIAEGKKVLAADPEGVGGYNAFVNEPAEDVARITLDETGDAIDFMSDQARIQNNVGTYEGRARPILDNDTQELLARADQGTRANILRKMETELGAKFDLTVGGVKLSAKEVSQAVDNLYDAAIAPIGKSFDDAVKGFRDLELKVGQLEDTVSGRGGREIMGKTIDRLVDALSPQRQRTSAAVQAQTAAGVSDIARNVELMEPVVDTSRLQELMMPRLRVLLKEQATSQVAESVSTMLQKKLSKQAATIEGALEIDEKYFDDMFNTYTQAVEDKAQVIDDFVDNLTEMAKDNPSYLRPVYKLYAKTNGEVDSMYKLNQYLNNRLGMLRKSIADGNPEVPSVILRELQSVRTANMINGTAPAKAWVGNLAAIATRPLTQLAGSVPVGLVQGDFKQLQRSLNAFGQFKETWRRASAMARDEWRYANANPNSAMARGRKDYDFSDGPNPKQVIADFEEMEELSETFSKGRQALWNATKTLSVWNGKNINRWGVNAMYSADGFLKSVMASFDSRLKAYDDVIANNNGAFNRADFERIEKELYDQAFDADGLIKPGYAKFASEEIALNADVASIQAVEAAMDKFPILKGIFMFPRTRVNAISAVQTFDPTGVLSLWSNRSWKTINANAGDPAAVKAILEMHGMKGGSVDDFLMLKSEYIGRKMATSSVIMGGAMIAMSGELTGSGSNMSPAQKARAIRAGFKPYMIHGRSYENAPDWVKLTLSLTADITNAFAGTNGEGVQDWYRAVQGAIAANVGNEFFGTEMETLSGLINGEKGSLERYFSGMMDTMIPGAGVRSALNNVLTPQLQDVENNFQSYLANRNRWITDPLLEDDIDPFTGEAIYGNTGPLEGLVGRVLPFWNTKGGTEPWRKWMLSTGWAGLSKPMVNPDTGEQLKPDQRQWINRWIGENGDWDKEMEKMMKWDDGKFEREWKRLHGRRAELDIGKTYIHEVLEEEKKRQFDAAWDAYKMEHPEVVDKRALQDLRDGETYEGNYGAALELQDSLNMYK